MILLREVMALVGAVGVVLLLVPWPWAHRRPIGLALAVLAWLAMGATVALDGTTLSAKLHRPVWIGAAVVGGLVALALVCGCARLVRARPGIWFFALALALPVRIPLPLGGGDSHNLLLPLYLVIAVGLALWFMEVRIEEAPRSTLDVPLALFVALSLVSVLWSSASSEAATKVAFFYLPFTLLFLLVSRMWNRAQALRILAWTTGAGSLVVAVIALVQFATRHVFWNATLQQGHAYSRFFRVNSIFYDPNILGRFLALSIVGAVAAGLWWRTPKVLIGVGAFCLIEMLALAVSVSRSATLQLMLGLTLLAARAYRPRRVLAVLAALLLVGGAVAAGGSKNVRRVVTDSQYRSHVSEGRFALVKGGLEIWRTAPVLGVGLGSFAKKYEQNLPPSVRKRTRVFISHNTPITVLSELGVVGLAGLGLLGVVVGGRVRKRSRSSGPAGWAAWTGLAMIAGIFLHSTLYAAFFEDPYLWTIAAGTMALVARVRPGANLGDAPGAWALGRAAETV
jgi:O-antigen ligase